MEHISEIKKEYLVKKCNSQNKAKEKKYVNLAQISKGFKKLEKNNNGMNIDYNKNDNKIKSNECFLGK